MGEPTTANEWQALINERIAANGRRYPYPGAEADMARYRAAGCREDAAHYRGVSDAAYEPTIEDVLIVAAFDQRSEGLMAELFGLDRVDWRGRHHAIKSKGYELAAERWEALAVLTGDGEGAGGDDV